MVNSNSIFMQSMLNSPQNGRYSFIFTTLLVHTTNPTIYTKNLLYYLSQFSPPYSTVTCSQIILQSPKTIPSSIPQQFLSSFFLRTTIPTIHTKNIFLPQPFRVRQRTRELESLVGSLLGSLVMTETFFICPFYLKVLIVIAGLMITGSSSLSLAKLMYCRCGKLSKSPSLIPSTYRHYFHTLLTPPQELTFPWKPVA